MSIGVGGIFAGTAKLTVASASFTVIQTDSGTAPTATGPNDTLTLTSGNALLTISGNATTDTVTFTVNIGSIDHNSLANLTVGDPHTQYLYLAGRAGGQSATGGTAASESLTLNSTSNGTKGKILIDSWAAFDESLQTFGVGTTSPTSKIQIAGNMSLSSWTTTGPVLNIVASTLTDTSGSGTIGSRVGSSVGIPTFASSSSVTVTAGAAFYVAGNAAAGTNTTITNAYGIWNVGRLRNDGFSGFGSVAAPVSVINIGNNQSSTSWTTAGLNLSINTNTLTDTSGSGTIATRVANSFGVPTFASSSSTTLTNAATCYIAGNPGAGSNTTITNAHALFIQGNAISGTPTNAYGLTVNGTSGATNNYCAQFLSGNVGIGVSDPQHLLSIAASGVTIGTKEQIGLRSQRAAIVTGNLIGGISFRSNDTNLTAPGTTVALIDAVAEATHTASVLDTGIVFYTTTTLTMAERMRISSAGNVSISSGNLIGVAKLHIDAGTATASSLKFTAGSTTGQTTTDGVDYGISAAGVGEIRQYEALAFNIYTNNIQSLSIASGGDFTVGQLSSGNAQTFTFSGQNTTTINTNGADMIHAPALGMGAGISGDYIIKTGISAVTSSITADGAATKQTGTAVTTNINWSHTVGSNSNRILLVAVGHNNSSDVISSVTFGAASLSRIVRGSAAQRDAELWYLLNPTSGTDTITVNCGTSSSIVGIAVSLYNVDQTNTFGTGTSAASSGVALTTPAITVSTAINEWVLSIATKLGNPEVPSLTSGTEFDKAVAGTGGTAPYTGFGYILNTSGTTSSPAWTWTVTARNSVIAGISLRPANSGTANTATEQFRVKQAGNIVLPTTVTSGGTTGNQTINKTSGTVNFAAAASSLTVTNSLVSTSSIVLTVVRTNDTTATIKNVVCSSGSFVITLAAAATAETSVGFVVIN